MNDRIKELRDLLDEIDANDALDEGFEAAKVGTVAKWKKGEFKKTNKGWVRVLKKGGGAQAPAPGKKPAPKAAAPAPTGKKRAATPPAAAAKPQGKVPPKGPAKPAPKAAAPAKGKAPVKGAPAKGAPAKTAPKKPAKKGDKPPTPAELSPDDVELPTTPKQKERTKKVGDRLKKSRTIPKSSKGVWNHLKNSFKTAAGKNRITENFFSKLGGEAVETAQMLKTVAKAFIPGMRCNPQEIVAAQHQFVDLAKGAMLASLAASPLGAVAVGLTAVGVRVDKVFDAFIDKPVRKATKWAFGREQGFLPSRFYADEDDEQAEKESRRRPKPKNEWKHAEDGDLESEDEPINPAEMQAAATEEGKEALANVLQQVLDYLSKMDPHDEDFAEALVAAGMTDDQVEEFIQFADASEPITTQYGSVKESVERFRRLARLD